MKYPTGKLFFQACLAFISMLACHPSYSQCAAAPIAAATCSGGNGAATNGLSIGSGKTYWVSGNSIFTSLTVNGGTLRICGTLIVSSLTLTSGNLIIESGGILIASSIGTLNGGVTIINRGTITASGGLTVQNTNYIYNELSTSVMTISGTTNFPSSNSVVVNRGTMTLSSLTYQASAGGFCLQAGSVTSLGALDNETTNGFSYSGNGFSACLNVSGTAKLNHNVTNSSLIHVCKGSGAVSGGATSSPGGGWGSATLYTSCSSCATVLSSNLLSFAADQQANGIRLSWTVNEAASQAEVFFVEKSSDGSSFNTFNAVASVAGQSSYSIVDPAMTAPVQYYRIKAVMPAGATFYSTVVTVETNTTSPFKVYPNPVGPDRNVRMLVHATAAGMASLSLLDRTGQILSTKNVSLTQGNNQLNWNLGNISAGMYLIRLMIPGKNTLYSRISSL